MLGITAIADQIDLSPYEQSIYSQNGEDGILAKLFSLLEPDTCYAVELGAYDGVTWSNTHLLRLQEWKCVGFDRLGEIPELSLFQEFITKENINKVFLRHRVPCEFDLLSIDLGYNDFYIWQAMDPKYKPSVVVIDFNGGHLPMEDKVVQYHPFYTGDGSEYYGASIRALYELGKSKGYSLIYVESTGHNLFFVREALLEEKSIHFKDQGDLEKLYRPFTAALRPDSKHRRYFSSLELLE
jgi:hypothetical protein